MASNSFNPFSAPLNNSSHNNKHSAAAPPLVRSSSSSSESPRNPLDPKPADSNTRIQPSPGNGRQNISTDTSNGLHSASSSSSSNSYPAGSSFTVINNRKDDPFLSGETPVYLSSSARKRSLDSVSKHTQAHGQHNQPTTPGSSSHTAEPSARIRNAMSSAKRSRLSLPSFDSQGSVMSQEHAENPTARSDLARSGITAHHQQVNTQSVSRLQLAHDPQNPAQQVHAQEPMWAQAHSKPFLPPRQQPQQRKAKQKGTSLSDPKNPSTASTSTVVDTPIPSVLQASTRPNIPISQQERLRQLWSQGKQVPDLPQSVNPSSIFDHNARSEHFSPVLPSGRSQTEMASGSAHTQPTSVRTPPLSGSTSSFQHKPASSQRPISAGTGIPATNTAQSSKSLQAQKAPPVPATSRQPQPRPETPVLQRSAPGSSSDKASSGGDSPSQDIEITGQHPAKSFFFPPQNNVVSRKGLPPKPQSAPKQQPNSSSSHSTGANTSSNGSAAVGSKKAETSQPQPQQATTKPAESAPAPVEKTPVATVFQCKKCNRIFSDSYSWVGALGSDSGQGIFVVNSVVNGSVQILRGTELQSSQHGVDKGASFYHIVCATCKTNIGRIYITSPPLLDFARNLYSFLVPRISFYSVGNLEESSQDISDAIRDLITGAPSAMSRQMAILETMVIALSEQVKSLEQKADERQQHK